MSGDAAPPWLFAFVDLAFLLLIAMTQIAPDPGEAPLLLGEIVVPRMHGETADLPREATRRWQLRVHPAEPGSTTPFELTEAQGEAGVRLERAELEERLQELAGAAAPKPILAPHKDSRSQDLLDAIELVEGLWPGKRRATVARLSPTP